MKMRESNHKKMIMAGLMMAMITVLTMFIQVPVPFTNGYIHLGDSMIFLCVLILGWKYGAVAAGAGSALADVFTGYIHWAPWTLGIKGLMALVMGLAIEACLNNTKRNTAVLAGVTAAGWIGFQLAARFVISKTAAANPESLFSSDVTSLSELGMYLNEIQGKLMWTALLIPVFLVAVTVYVRKKENFIIPVYQILGMTLSGMWMVFGYYVAGGFLYGNFASSAFSIPANMIQFVLGFFIAMVLAAALLKTPASQYFTYGLQKRDLSAA